MKFEFLPGIFHCEAEPHTGTELAINKIIIRGGDLRFIPPKLGFA